MKKIFKERPMPDDIEFKEKDYGKRANAFVAAAGIAAAALLCTSAASVYSEEMFPECCEENFMLPEETAGKEPDALLVV